MTRGRVVVKYLTHEWVEGYRGLGAELPERPGAAARIQYMIDAAAGRVTYHVVFEDRRVVASALVPVIWPPPRRLGSAAR